MSADMRRVVRLVSAAAFLLFASVPKIYSLDYPHNDTNGIGCSTCHWAHLSSAPAWLTQSVTSDDTINNNRCRQCHDGSVPGVKAAVTHSALSTGSIKWDGAWKTECVDCHEQHSQAQHRRWGAEAYIATGTVASIGAYNAGQNETPITLSAVLGDEYEGYYIVPNTLYKNYSYKIKESTLGQTEIKVKGRVNMTYAGSNKPFAIVYAKNVNAYLSYKNPGGFVRTANPKLLDQTGFGDDSDDHTSSARICEVCHTETLHHRFDTTEQPDTSHYNNEYCMNCHNHANGFAHGGSGGGSGCIECHGHDAGTLYDPDLTAPYAAGSAASQGKGSFRSHSTHTESHISGSPGEDDRKGPGMYCADCHDITRFPLLKDGKNLAATTVCDPCHSEGGTYKGVSDPDIGAKANWKYSIYEADSRTLKAGKEKWCAGCHDNSPSVISEVSAPNVAGDEGGAYTYGTGWGFYKTGHGLPSGETYPASGGITAGAGAACGDCHDSSISHIDGLARTFDDGNSSTTDPSVYRIGYRLKTVAPGSGTGASTQEPMLVPWPGPTVNSANNYRLCVNCHNSGPFLNSGDMNTNLVTDGINRHQFHMGLNYQLRYASDWDSTVNSQINCVACHNVHGSTRLAMVRDGKLIGREPGLQIWYNNSAIINPTTPPDPQDLPLSASTGTIWIPGSSGNLCTHCHGGGVSAIEDRTPYQNVQQTPTLEWTGENGYTNDGVNPNSGPSGGSFTFRVKYTDTNNNAPTTYQVWVDTNDNGVYDAGEKINMSEVDSVDKNYYNGKLYTYTMPLSKYGDNTFTYRFKFSDGTVDATGDPASDRPVTVTNNAPILSWTGESYYQDSGVYPASGGNNATYTFRVNYNDADNECPPAASDIQAWIDENNNGTYDPGEKHNMTAADGNACSSGRVYTYSTTLAHAGDGELSYTFRASDGFTQAAADAEPLSDNIVTVLAVPNTPPQLDWESGACRIEGVSPRAGATGAEFTFLVKYTDQNNSCPASGSSNIQVWIDENSNGIYEPGEKYNLTEVDAGDTDCTNGKLYKTTRTLAYAGDGNLNYRFYATDGTQTAIGDPADYDGTVTVVNGVRKVRPTGGSGWYSTIQSAVAANQTILVYPNADFTPATYNESVAVNGVNNVTIRSVCGPDYTIIDGVGSGYVVWANSISSNLTVDGFSLTGDTNGIYANGSTPVTVSNCKIHSNTGVGVSASNGANLAIDNCEIYSNASATVLYGGGIYLNGGTHTILNSTVRNNTSQSGAGLYAVNVVSATITDTTIRDNTATGIAGGIYINAGMLNLSKSTISGNTSSSAGGGLYTNSGPTVNIENCLLVNNRGTAGGMLYLNSGTVTVKNCTIADNEATSGNGGAIYTNNVPVIVRNSIFWNNFASGDGHNLFKNGDLLSNGSTITDSDIMTGRYYIGNCVPTFANNIAADPFFAGSDNYHLQANSPAIDTANAAYAPADDRDGNVRPQGAGSDMGAYEFASGVPETEAPVVTNFTATSPSSSRNIPITAFTATDNTDVTGYRITTSPTPPSASEGGWSSTAPATYLVTSDGTHILYPWAKDASGNVSEAFGSPATVVVDATAPDVTAFTATSPSTSFTIPITSFTAFDVVGVTGYQITTNSTPPAVGGGGWSGTAPLTYTVGSDGTYTLYPWAIDAIGNVSAVYATPVTVVVDTTPPTVSSTTPSNGATGVIANSPVTINWNENVDCSTVTTSTVTISPASGWIRTSCSGSEAVYSPSGQSNSTLYSVTVSTSVKDAAGNAMALPYEFSYTTAAVSNYAPVLNWASATNCLAEGVRPRTGAINADFEFRVVYSDADGQCPSGNAVTVTVNGTPTSLTTNDGASCTTGRTYYGSITIASAGDLNYFFSASDGIDTATGTPTGNHTVSVINTTYKVRPTGGSGWYSDLATAYNATPASGTLLVYPNADFTAATYTGGLSNINKTNRTLQSVCGADLTIISGGANVISLQGNDGAVIDGFRITAGTTYGIYSNADSLTVKNSKIYSNPTGMHLNNGCNPVSIQNSEIYNNTSYGINSPSLLNLVSITNSNIHNNGGGATNGAGINFNGGAGTHTINNTLLTGNTTTGNGGAIYCVNCAISIDDSTINNNKGGAGGALFFLNPSVNAAITDTFIQGNEATGTLGGAIYMGNGAESLTNVMLTGNKAATNGGAIYINGGTTNLLYSTLSGNYAGGYGGALYQNSSTQTTIQNSIIYNNDALNGGNYKQIFATSPRYTYIDIYYTLINQLPGANIAGPPDQRCSYENLGGNLTASNPNFVDGGATPPTSGSTPTTGGDYHLQSGSPAVNAASSSWTVDHDIFGGSRPLGVGYDMGAHEKE